MRSLKKQIFKNAPRVLLGAFFLCLSCKDEEKPLESPKEPAPVQSENKPSVPPATESEPQQEPTPPKVAPTTDAEGIRFMAYNIENYLTMTRYLKGGGKQLTSKDPKEIAALVDIIVKEKPDILGICEIGTADDLKDLQSRLKVAGLDLTHALHTGGADTTRHLGILSAFPIAANDSQKEVAYQIDGRDRMVGRGILDVTINLPGGPTHFIGLHLKSKRELDDFDQAEIRLNEARLARDHCEALMAKDANARLVVYGDMNDTRKTPPLAVLMGKYQSPTYLGDVFVKDSRDHLWTHFWSYQQQYARFDWVLVSPAMYHDVDPELSYISDRDNWNEASDHRAIVVTLKK
ncbi:MAG: endonuclease/exonuclease/phosphatase family metal-dependent hydrolase [Akkermansiaceae bacterium]|jgi:endonuclease/exonuclease/phosphatase family metal-dependent hydrolase